MTTRTRPVPYCADCGRDLPAGHVERLQLGRDGAWHWYRLCAEVTACRREQDRRRAEQEAVASALMLARSVLRLVYVAAVVVLAVVALRWWW